MGGAKGPQHSLPPPAPLPSPPRPPFTEENGEELEGGRICPRTLGPIEAEHRQENRVSMFPFRPCSEAYRPVAFRKPCSACGLLGPVLGESQPGLVCLTPLQPSPKANHPSFVMGALGSNYNTSTKAKKLRRRPSGELVFAPAGNLGTLNLSACPAQIPSRSCLAQVYRAHVFLLGKGLEGKGSGTVPRHWGRCPLPTLIRL